MSESREQQIDLYLYGEMTYADRDAFEAEIGRSEELARAVETQRGFLRAMNEREPAEVSEALLAECRHDLMREVYRERHGGPASVAAGSGWWARFIQGLNGMQVAWQPTAAVALLALGFWGGRMAPGVLTGNGGTNQAGFVNEASDPVGGDVRSVEFSPESGGVEIVLEQRRTIRGNPDDPLIRGLLISNVQSPNSGVRLETLEALQPRTNDSDIRSALISVMLGDQNPGVRLKALEMLAAHRAQPEVRDALVESLRRDPNAGMRVQAVDLLTDSADREMVGTLQELVRDEQDSYVRYKVERLLHDMSASVDLY